MTVYVDDLFEATPRTAQARSHGRRWCHMEADTEAELDAMARKIGLKVAYKQNGDRWLPWRTHYDLVPSKRALAVRYGAVELTSREMGARAVRLMEEHRQAEAHRGVEIMPGVVAHVAADASPELLGALRRMAQAAIDQFGGERER